jgi:hypothetical protein
MWTIVCGWCVWGGGWNGIKIGVLFDCMKYVMKK